MQYSLEGIRDSIHDLSRNPLSDSAYKVKFTTPEQLRPPTPPKFLNIDVRDSARDIGQLPSFTVSFSDAVNKDSARTCDSPSSIPGIMPSKP